MANDTKTVAIRLVVVDGGAVKAELRDVGAIGEQSLQRIDTAAGSTSRALTVIDNTAVSASRSLVVLDQASGGVTRSLSTANDNAGQTVDNLERMAGAADRTSKAVSAIPPAFQLLAAVVAVDAAVHAVGLLKDIVVTLGRELGEQMGRFHEWAREADGSTGAVARQLEFMAAKRAALAGMEFAGVGLAARAAAGTALTGLYISAETVGVLVDASKAARDYAAAQKAVADELDRTGHASQRTTAQVMALSKTMADGTRYTAVEIANTGRELLKFRSITGDVFDRAVTVSADLAAKMGTDLPTAANLLARALEDPARGTAELAEKGINLTFAQREQIKTFADAGEKAKAQGVILDAVAGKTGGAAAKMTEAERASKSLADAWDALAVTVGTRLNSVLDDLAKGWNDVGDALSNVLAPLKELMSGELRTLNAALSPDTLDKQLSDTATRLQTAKAAYDQAVTDSNHDEAARLGMDVEILERKKATLERQIEAVRKRGAQERGEIGQRQTDDRSERFAGERTSLDRQLESVIKPTTAEQIARVNTELDKTKARLESLRAPDGSNKAEIDKALADAERVAKAKRKAVEDAAKDGTGDDDAVARQIDAMREERDALGMTARERAMHTALLRAEQAARQEDTALTRDQAETVLYEAGALYDAKAAQDAHNKAMAEGKSITEAMRTPAEAYNDQMRHLSDLLNEGAINWSTYERASKAAVDKMQDAGKKSDDVGRQLGMTFESSFEKAIFGGQKLRGVLSSLAADLAKIALRKGFTEGLFGAASGLFSSAIGSMGMGTGVVNGATPLGMWQGFHTGGIVGAGSAMQIAAPASVFAGAPRYHDGGVAGLGPGEVPAILKRGEGVFTPEQIGALGGGGSVINQTVNVTVEGGSKSDPAADEAFGQTIARQVKDQIRALMFEEIRRQQRPGGMLSGGY